MTEPVSTTKKFRDRETFSLVEAEGALCAWEWMLENRDGDLMKGYFEGIGAGGMRMVSMQAGAICQQVHERIEARGYEYSECFDWEFVPAVLQRLDWKALTEDYQFNGEPYAPDIDDFLTVMITADMAESTDPDKRAFTKIDKRAAWYDLARQAGVKHWGYGDLVNDHPERAKDAFLADQDPVEFIKYLGDKYDLTPASSW